MGCDEIIKLADLAKTQPQAAFAAFIHGEQHRFTYFLRTISGMEKYLKPLDDVISNTFLPALFGSSISDIERDHIALPIRYGGLGIANIAERATNDYSISRSVNASLIAIIVTQGDDLPDGNIRKKKLADVKKENNAKLQTQIEKVEGSVIPQTLRVIEQTKQPGASNWLSVMPSDEHGFNLNKSEFRDALALRFNRPIKGLPSNCPCGQKFDLSHALNCKKRRFYQYAS